MNSRTKIKQYLSLLNCILMFENGLVLFSVCWQLSKLQGENGRTKLGRAYRYCGWRMDERYSAWWWYNFLFCFFNHPLSRPHLHSNVSPYVCPFAAWSLRLHLSYICRSSITTSTECSDWWHRRLKYVFYLLNTIYLKLVVYLLEIRFICNGDGYNHLGTCSVTLDHHQQAVSCA